MQWLDTEFLQYLKEWEAAVENRDDVTAAEKKLMILSRETLIGLKLTSKSAVLWYITYMHISPVVKSFIELAKILLRIPGAPPFLSRRITQDPLEKFFGLQRQRGRVNENPNVQEFQKNSQALRVIQACTNSIKGNCRGNKDIDATEHTPLPRRSRGQSNFYSS